MGEVMACSQLSLLLLPKYQLKSSTLGFSSIAQFRVPTHAVFSMHVLGKKSSILSPTQKKQCSWGIKATMTTDFKLPTTYVVDSTGEQVDVLADTSGGSGGGDNDSGSSGGGGGGGDNSGGGREGASDEGNEGNDVEKNKKTGMSMSQKLTLGYAILVGVGGIMGYLKSGSQNSLIAGGLSASLLCLVYTLLPAHPVLASSLGLGLSGSLLGVMGSRFLKSSKIFPAGVVTFVSLVMSGGYLHGIMRSLH